MFNQFLPKRVDNAYRGQRPALWLLGLAVLMKAGIGLECIFNGRHAAASADGIPLDTFTSAGAQTVVALFAIWGLSQLVLCSLCVLALVRYRALVPLMYAVLLLEYLGRKGVLHYLPVPRVGPAPGVGVNAVLLVLMVVGLALSLWAKGGPKTRE